MQVSQPQPLSLIRSALSKLLNLGLGRCEVAEASTLSLPALAGGTSEFAPEEGRETFKNKGDLAYPRAKSRKASLVHCNVGLK